jgi:cobalt/nickel transport system ATP-binding protein
MSHHLVEARNLHFSYPDGTQVLRGVSFTITHGESVAIVGANGSGKSTLLLHLCGCLFPSSGEARIGEFPVTKETLKTVRRSVGLVFEDPDDQLFMPTVFEDVAFGPINCGVGPQQLEDIVMHALATVNAAHLRDRPPYRLSEGEKRAVAIASVLSMSPDVLVMDEPSSNLDPLNRRSLIGLLNKFSHTKIVASHDLDMVCDVCARTIVLHDGQVAADGPTEKILHDDGLLKRNHLERPLKYQ